MPGSLPFMPMFPNGGVPFAMGANVGAAYDPHESQMDMRPQLGGMGSGARSQARAPLLPRVQEDGGQTAHIIRASGELPVIQDLTPNPPSNNLPQGDVPGEINSSNGISMNPMPVQVQPSRPLGDIMDVDVAMPTAPPNGGFRGGTRGRGRSNFPVETHNFHMDRRNDKTLVVEKIPDDKLSLDAVNGWFKRFGTVTNVAVDAPNKKALVSFLNHEEAYAAWKTEDAVFNNRFVKLFWHRPMDGHGQVGARMLAASAPLVASMSTKETTPASSTPSTQPAVPASIATSAVAQPRKAPAASTPVSALAAKQRQLEQHIAEQKILMAKLAMATPDEKKQIMTRLRKLGEEMKPSTDSPASSSSTTSLPVQKQATPTPSGDHEQKERERLDKELELHTATLAVEGELEESTEDLKAKLERLKAEASLVSSSLIHGN